MDAENVVLGHHTQENTCLLVRKPLPCRAAAEQEPMGPLLSR